MTLRREGLVVAGGLALYLAVALSAAFTHSATFDESLYLPAGYAALRGDYRVAAVHPPLPRLLSALPLLFLSVRFDEADPAWLEPHGWKFAHRFLYLWNDADRLLRPARAMSTVFALLLAVGVYLAARRRWGPRAAAFALGLTVFTPEVLAHGALVTNDLPVACFFFLAVTAVERLRAGAAPGQYAAAGIALGAALLSKHSALLLAVLLPALVVITERRDPRRLPRALGRLALVGAIAYVVLWAGYRFRYSAGRPEGGQGLSWRAASEPEPVIGRLARQAGGLHLLPEAYAIGLADLATRSQSRPGFLLGRHSREGWWYYFPLAFVLKTPLPLLVLFAVAAAAARAPGGSFLWVPVAAFGAVSMTTKVDIGVRYLLPVLPFLLVAAGGAVEVLWTRGRAARAAAVLLLAWHAGGTLRHHPHHLSFFNEIAGGPYGGYRYLVDSNLDWGQDLKRLAEYVRAHGSEHLRLSYFGTASPEYYGIPHDLLPSVMRPFPERFLVHIRPGDLVAVSATNLQGVYLPRVIRPLLDRLEAEPPLARIGPSIFVYRVGFHWLLKPALAEEAGWREAAAASYRECLERDPEHAAQAGEYLAALEAAGAPAAVAPDDGLR